MSLLAIAASAALAVAAQPVHSVDVHHSNGTYRVDYRPHVETSMRTVGMAAGPRPSTQSCVVSATVMVERVISSGRDAQALKSVLPGGKNFTRQLAGHCSLHSGGADKLLAKKDNAVRSLLSQVADDDRQGAMSAIDSAHQFASK